VSHTTGWVQQFDCLRRSDGATRCGYDSIRLWQLVRRDIDRFSCCC